MGSQLCEERIIMAVDEYETIRLIDLAGYTQEECAAQMGIARTTVQGIYNDARRKLADALVNGKMLFIEGGDIDICERENAGCGRKCGQLCRKEMKDEKTRKLIFVNEELGYRFFLSKATDVPTYVEMGAADIGVVGKDVEHHPAKYLFLCGFRKSHLTTYHQQFLVAVCFGV